MEQSRSLSQGCVTSIPIDGMPLSFLDLGGRPSTRAIFSAVLAEHHLQSGVRSVAPEKMDPSCPQNSLNDRYFASLATTGSSPLNQNGTLVAPEQQSTLQRVSNVDRLRRSTGLKPYLEGDGSQICCSVCTKIDHRQNSAFRAKIQ